MKNFNILKGLFTFVFLAVLAGCGGSSSSSSGSVDGGDGGGDDNVLRLSPIAPQPMLPGDEEAYVVAIYPALSAREVPVTAQPTLRFSGSIHGLDDIVDDIYIVEDDEDTGDLVPFTPILADRGRTLILRPNELLKPNQYYKIGYRTSSGSRTHESFTTGGDPDGDMEARSLDVTEMKLERILPRNQWGTHPLNSDYIQPGSTVRLVHSQPVDPSTVRYGDDEDSNIKVVKRDSNEFVPAQAIVQDRIIVIVPDEPWELSTGYEVIYEGNNADAIHSIYDQPYNPSTTATFGVEYTLEPGWLDGIPANVEGGFGDLEQNSPWTDDFVNELAGDGTAPLPITLSHQVGNWLMASFNHFWISTEALSGEDYEPIVRSLGDNGGNIAVTFPADISGAVGMLRGTPNVKMHVTVYIALDGGEPQPAVLEMAGHLIEPTELGEDVVIEVVGAVDPALLGQPREPGNGMLTLQLRVPTSDLASE